MKAFLLAMNKRRNSNVSEAVIGGRLVNDHFNQMWPTVLLIEHGSVFLPCRLGHPGYN